MAERRGHLDDTDIAALRRGGYDDAAMVEIVAQVAENVFTNFLKSVAQTAIDFPAAAPLAAG